jgi:hypothetical protein
MGLTAEAILAAEDRPSRDVEVPEWGGSVKVRSMSLADREAYEKALDEHRDKDGNVPNAAVLLLLALHSACDDNGARLFTEANLATLAEKNWQAIKRVANAAIEVNAIGAASVEEARKN